MDTYAYGVRYMAALKKLAGGDKQHVCQKKGCKTLCLGSHCLKHIQSEEIKQKLPPED